MRRRIAQPFTAERRANAARRSIGYAIGFDRLIDRS
jgi:hypothetical protein